MMCCARRSLSALAVLTLSLVLLVCSLPVLAADYVPDPTAPRSEVPDQFKWRTDQIFPDAQAWADELAAFDQDIAKFAEYEGHLGDDAETLYEFLQFSEDMDLRASRLYLYANLNFDVDQSNAESQARLGRVRALFPKYSRAVAFAQPELLALDPAKVEGFLDSDENLSIYRFFYEELRRQEKYTLSQGEEQLLALTGNVRAVPSNAHQSLLNVDIEFPEIVNEQGETVRLTLNGFPKYRSSTVYEVREQAATAFFATLRQFENTFATLLDGVVKSHILNVEARGYDNCLQAALYPQHISPAAYHMLIDTIDEHLDSTLHKYVALRRKVLGLDGPLTFANLYNPMITDVEQVYTYDQGRKLVHAALAPMGKEYVALADEGMAPASGWTDIYPNMDKDSGAYSNGSLARDLHPFVKQNFDDTLDAVFTTAHEFGHALHSVYSHRNQPAVYAGYTTFLAEIASTCNEALLTDYLLERAKTPAERLNLLNQRLESIRLTIFRQTLFAEFELRAHEYAEQGNALTADYLNGLYKELIQKYYGSEFAMGPNDECEWMFIPHFYYNFYVFTYATGLTSGLSMATQIEQKGEKAARRYIDNMLKAGSSAPPLEILKNAGVDLETPAPILDMLNLFEKTIDQFDKIWTENYGRG